MEIGISDQQLWEVGLNMAGFLVAGLILLLIQSLFRRKRSSKDQFTDLNKSNLESLVAEKTAPEPELPIRRHIEDPTEFVNLSGKSMNQSSRSSSYSGYNRINHDRNRIEVLNLAKNLRNKQMPGQNNRLKSLEENRNLPINNRKNLISSGGK